MGWYLAPSLVRLRAEVDAAFEGRDRRSDGSIGDAAHRNTRSDHNPDSRGRVDAIDLDENPAVGSSREDVGDGVWAMLLRVKPKQLKYAIYEGRIVSSYDHRDGPAYTPRPYTGSNPHTGHVHVSVLDQHAETSSPWGLATVTEENDMLKRGDEGPAVKRMQQALLRFGTGRTDDPWPAARKYGTDGDFGPTTEGCVRDFQRAAGLPVTGTIEGVTAAFLVEYVADHHDNHPTGGTHGHKVTGRLTVAGTTDLGRELAKQLTVTGAVSVKTV